MSYRAIRSMISGFKAKVKDNIIIETLKHTNNYFIANIFTTGISFITLPIFTYLMSTSEIGIYSVFMAMTGFTMVLLGFNLYASVSRYYYEDRDDFNSFLSTSLILTFIAATIVIFVYLAFEPFFDKIINLPYPLGPYLVILSVFLILDSIYKQILVAMKKSKQFFWITTSKFFIIIVLAIPLVYLLPNDKYLGRIWPILLVNFVYAIYYLINVLKMSKFNFKLDHIKYLVIFSIPLIPYTISSTILNYFDRIFINFSKGAADSGLYAIGYSIATLVSIGVSAVHSAQTPEFFKLMREEQYGKYFLLIRRLFSLLTVFGLSLILFSREVLDLLTDPKFHSSYIVIPPVVLGYLFYSLFYVYGQYIGYVKKTIYLSIIVVTAGLINIYFNVLLIPTLGIVAGAYTTFISYLSLFIMSWIVAKFILKQVTVPFWLIVKPMVILLIFVSFYFYFLNFLSNFFVILFFKIILIGFFISIVFFEDLKKVVLTK